MKNRLFNQVSIIKPKSNVFDLSHEKKLSCNMGELIPVYLQEIIPGDKFRVNTEILMRMAPMLVPVMHRVNVYVHYFFVPNRLVYKNWPTFITGGEDGNQVPAFPRLTFDNSNKSQYGIGTLADYLGVPTLLSTSGATVRPLLVSALPFRAYHMIWNEYYRDQNLQSPIGLTTNDSCDPTEQGYLTELRMRCWEKDYFTSALPWAQRGGSVTLPNTPAYKTASEVKHWNGSAFVNSADGALSSASGHSYVGANDASIQNIDGIDISINDLRRASRLQEWLEKNARAGSRYIEQILSHFGVVSSDARLQRPEYLGGGKQPVVISEVLNMTGTAERPQGDMAGHGISVGSSNSFQKSFEEHGYVMGIMSVLPRTSYQQGCDRSLQKFDKFDYFWPEFANLGEQAINRSEIYHDYDNAVTGTEAAWGYQSRYAEYKFKPSSVHGDFKETLEYWHMGRVFGNTYPPLNSDFVKADPTKRIFAVDDESDHLWVQLYNDVKAIRPMPVFGVPTL